MLSWSFTIEMEQGEIGLKGESKELGSHQYPEYYYDEQESRVNEDETFHTNDSCTSKQKVIFQCHFGTVCSHRLECKKQGEINTIYIGKSYFKSHWNRPIL